MAIDQGRSELNCPTATAEVVAAKRISRTYTTSHPQTSGAMVMLSPVQASREAIVTRWEYLIAVAGCGRKVTYTLLCPGDGTGCYVIGVLY